MKYVKHTISSLKRKRKEEEETGETVKEPQPKRVFTARKMGLRRASASDDGAMPVDSPESPAEELGSFWAPATSSRSRFSYSSCHFEEADDHGYDEALDEDYDEDLAYPHYNYQCIPLESMPSEIKPGMFLVQLLQVDVEEEEWSWKARRIRSLQWPAEGAARARYIDLDVDDQRTAAELPSSLSEDEIPSTVLYLDEYGPTKEWVIADKPLAGK